MKNVVLTQKRSFLSTLIKMKNGHAHYINVIELRKTKETDLIKKSEFGTNLEALKNEIPNTTKMTEFTALGK